MVTAVVLVAKTILGTVVNILTNQEIWRVSWMSSPVYKTIVQGVP